MKIKPKKAGPVTLTSLEMCAGIGGQMIGLEQAGFEPVALVDSDPDACETLRTHRPRYRVLQTDMRRLLGSGHGFDGVDLYSAGLPKVPFGKAGRQRGSTDARNLIQETMWSIKEVRPRAVLIESVPALTQQDKFADLHAIIDHDLSGMGYIHRWKIIEAEGFGVPQLRPHAILVAMRQDDFDHFTWPVPTMDVLKTVGDTLLPSMSRRGWEGAREWAAGAQAPAPIIVGGSEDRGGPDLGPTGSKRAWGKLGVCGKSLADDVPGPGFVLRHGVGRNGWDGFPRLTIDQVAELQGLPEDWRPHGKKGSRYRQVASCTPPAVAAAVGTRIAAVLTR